MKVGTRSLLFGVHQFLIHPLFTFVAWRRLYGFPKSLPLYVAFVVHDWGYWGKPNMDGEEGESHPEIGAAIMHRFFGEEWGEFTLCHSRHYARQKGRNFSQLAVADKLACLLYPRWLYVLLARLSGEIKEYRSPVVGREYNQWHDLLKDVTTDEQWFDAFVSYMGPWVAENRDKGEKPPGERKNVNGEGVGDQGRRFAGR